MTLIELTNDTQINKFRKAVSYLGNPRTIGNTCVNQYEIKEHSGKNLVLFPLLKGFKMYINEVLILEAIIPDTIIYELEVIYWSKVSDDDYLTRLNQFLIEWTGAGYDFD